MQLDTQHLIFENTDLILNPSYWEMKMQQKVPLQVRVSTFFCTKSILKICKTLARSPDCIPWTWEKIDWSNWSEAIRDWISSVIYPLINFCLAIIAIFTKFEISFGAFCIICRRKKLQNQWALVHKIKKRCEVATWWQRREVPKHHGHRVCGVFCQDYQARNSKDWHCS